MSKKKDHKTEVIPKGVKVDATCPLHKDEPINNFCPCDIELCCTLCKHEGRHKSHKVYDLSEVSKDNEVFSAAKVREYFGGVLKCDDVLEKKIVTTIENVQEENVSVKEKVSQSFREAHKRLNAEEAAVMEELEKACNEAEEALQKALDSLSEVREYSAMLSDANSKTEGKRSRLMELNIVCEMEKQMKAMDELHRKMMKDLKVDWDSEKRKLSFTRNLINGAPIPNKVILSDITNKSVEIRWRCDSTEEMSEADNKCLMYRVEARKFKDIGWKEVYRGKDKKCSVSGLEKNTKYNVCVKCVVGRLQGMWSDVVTFKTKKIYLGSAILSNEPDKEKYEEKLSEWCGTDDFELLYRGTRDGFDGKNFNRLCNNKGKTLALIKNTSGHIFGGFASVPWMFNPFSLPNKRAPGSFLFTLTNKHGIEPTKFSLRDEVNGSAVCHIGFDQGPMFGDNGDDLKISSCCNAVPSFSSFPKSYVDTTEKGRTLFSSNTSDTGCFKVQEIEVFKVSC